MNRKALGKGLDALIPHFELGVPKSAGKDNYLLIDEIVPNRNQPRKYFDDEKMKELVESIREQGIIQPIVVQKNRTGYEIIVGERRWRAAKKAGLKKIPALVKELDDGESLEMAIIENIHRHDLNPIEEAMAYSKLATEFGLKQEEIAQRVGKKRASIANFMRLLKLSRSLQEDIVSGRITMGHAMALLSLASEKEIEALRKQIIKEGLNVRQTENIAKRKTVDSHISKRTKHSAEKDRFLEILETKLARSLGTKVKIVAQKNGGTVTISYYSEEDLERICDVLVSKMK